MKDFSYITQSHPAYIEGLYNDFVQDPESVDPDFRKFFEGFDFAMLKPNNGQANIAGNEQAVAVDADQLSREFAVYRLIEAYRKKGHLVARTNPIRERKDRGAELDLKYFGLKESDLQQNFAAAQFAGLPQAKLEQVIDKLKKTYCGHIGVEYK